VSHLVKTKSCLKRKDIVIQACEELGIEVLDGKKFTLEQSYGVSAKGMGIRIGKDTFVLADDGTVQHSSYVRSKGHKGLTSLKMKYNTIVMKEELARRTRKGGLKYTMREKKNEKTGKMYVEIDVE